jgi:hypothetical protein
MAIPLVQLGAGPLPLTTPLNSTITRGRLFGALIVGFWTPIAGAVTALSERIRIP